MSLSDVQGCELRAGSPPDARLVRVSPIGSGPGGREVARYLQYEVREGREAREAGDLVDRIIGQNARFLAIWQCREKWSHVDG